VASLLVVPREHGGTVSGVLIARDSGYLAVEVSFHGDAVPGLKVQFYFATEDGERGDEIGNVVFTDDHGIACAQRVVPSGLYVCAVENQDDLVVSTVADFDDAYPVVLPVGRSYIDMNDGVEFESQDRNKSGDTDGGEDSAEHSDEDGPGADTANNESGDV
jgi:hypothetical protein